MTALRAEGLWVQLGGQDLLAGVDLELAPGKVTLLAGRNGSGKTTLLNVLAGIRVPDGGSVTLDGQDLAAVPARTRAQRLTIIPQEADSPFEFTGRELVMMGRHPHIARFASPDAEDLAAVERALQRTDSAGFADRSVTTLSGGERRRMGIARALATDAEILLADEPTANLDLDHALATLELFRNLAAEGRTVLLVSHDLNLTAPHADLVALLHHGQIRAVAEPDEALDALNLAEVFSVGAEAPTGYFPRAFRKL